MGVHQIQVGAGLTARSLSTERQAGVNRMLRRTVCFPRPVSILSLSVLVLLIGPVPAQKRPSMNKMHTVLIKGLAFVPQRLEVRAGDTVIWKNEDIVPHTATAQHTFDSKQLGPQQSWSYVAKRKGIYPFICTYHPTMEGELVVK